MDGGAAKAGWISHAYDDRLVWQRFVQRCRGHQSGAAERVASVIRTAVDGSPNEKPRRADTTGASLLGTKGPTRVLASLTRLRLMRG
jgi:hypothetical protein